MRGPKYVLVSGGLKIVALVPGRANECLLKSCMLSRTEYVEGFGRTCVVRNMMR